MSTLEKWNENWEDIDTDMHGQTGNLAGQQRDVRVNLALMLQSFHGIGNKFLSASMEGTTIAASDTGRMARDNSEHRGWFTYKAVAKMTLDWSGIPKGPLGSVVYIKKDAPATTTCRGSVSSNSEYSVGGNLGGMAGSPMGGINASYSTGTSFSKQISGFKIINNSDDLTMDHTYHLDQFGGREFHDAMSLNHSTIFKHNLYSLDNDQAISNLPIVSQCTWATRKSSFADTLFLEVTVEHWMVNIFAITGIEKFEVQRACWTTTKQFPVDFSMVANPL